MPDSYLTPPGAIFGREKTEMSEWENEAHRKIHIIS